MHEVIIEDFTGELEFAGHAVELPRVQYLPAEQSMHETDVS